jgi:hypothetical protein
MSWFTSFIAASAFFLGLSWFDAWIRNPVWTYRISITVETPEGIKTAEVVREAEIRYSGWFENLLIPGGYGIGETRGEALALEVLPGRWLFGLTDERGVPVPADIRGEPEFIQSIYGRAFFYRARPEGYGRDITINQSTVYETIPEGIEVWQRHQIENRNRDLARIAPRDTYPGTLVTFRDITDPTTIELVDLADLEATFGSGVRFVSGRYEFTHAPRTIGQITEDWLPWLGSNESLRIRNLVKVTDGQKFYRSQRIELSDFDTQIFRR